MPIKLLAVEKKKATTNERAMMLKCSTTATTTKTSFGAAVSNTNSIDAIFANAKVITVTHTRTHARHYANCAISMIRIHISSSFERREKIINLGDCAALTK